MSITTLLVISEYVNKGDCPGIELIISEFAHVLLRSCSGTPCNAYPNPLRTTLYY